jgi:DNA-binding CsgD family transcriptional regulator
MAAVRRLSSPFLIGRVPELAELRDALDRVAAGEAGTIVVAGEAGVGKTRFLAAFATAAARTGALVLRGGCVNLGHGVLPYAPVVEALRPVANDLDPGHLARVVGPRRVELARLLPELDTEAERDRDRHLTDQGRLFEALLGLLGRLAEERPTVLVLEDLHWADSSTRDLVAFLARNLARERFLLIGSYRTDELERRHPLRPLLAELDRIGSVARIELARFSGEEVREQLRAIVGHEPDPDLVERVLARSEGNPFFVEELVAADAMPGSTGLSSTLRDILIARIERLSEGALELLRLVAVAGRTIDERLLARAAGLDDDVLTVVLREALAHQVLVSSGGPSVEKYAFRHALLQEAVYSDMLGSERRRLHRSIAEALDAQPELAATDPAGAAAERAHHWFMAHRLPEALAASVEAAVIAERAFAYPEALAHYERALDLWEEVPDAASVTALDRVELAIRAGTAAVRSNDDRRAVALLEAALADVEEQADPEQAGRIHVELLNPLVLIGDRDRAEVALRKALRLVPADPPTATRSRLLIGSANKALHEDRYAEARAIAAEAHSVARQAGATSEAGDAMDVLVFATVFAGDVDAALAYATDRRRLAEAGDDPRGIARAFHEIGFVLQADLRFEEAVSVFLDGAAVTTRLGLERSWRGELEWAAAESMRRGGRWSEADALSRVVSARGGPVTVQAHELRAFLLAGMGRLDEAEWHADVVWKASGGRLAVAANRSYYPARADIALWRGRFEEARDAIRRGLALFEASEDVRWVGELAVRGVRAEAELADLARTERSRGALDEARRRAKDVLQRIEELARRAKEAGSIFARESDAPVLLARAEWGRLEGASDPDLWAAAASAWLDVGQPYQASYASYRRAEALLARRASRGAVMPILIAARDTASRLGAAPLLTEIEALASRARLPLERADGPGASTAPPKPDHPLAAYGLTKREREVLALLSDGSSDRAIANALFISEKTVSVHISNIKGKLGVPTRLEAATIALRTSRTRRDRADAP